MKNIGRKMLGLTLAISMLCSLLPMAVMATPTTDGYYIKLEETDRNARDGFGQKASLVSMSGSDATENVRIHWAKSGGYLNFDLNIAETGNYTIWVHGGTSDNNYVSPSKLVLDDTTDLNWETIQNSVQESGMSFRTAYHSVTTYLTAGEHTIKYVLTSARPSGDGNWAGAFDFMLIMPSNYSWTPSITALPVAPTYVSNAWVEGEDYTRSNYTSTRSGDDCDISLSGNKILHLGSSSIQGYSEYDINLRAGTYDIYVLGGDNFYGGTWTSNVTPSVDGVAKEYSTVAYDGWPKWGGSTKNYDQGWVKISNVALTKGTHTIRWAYLDSRTSSSTYYAGGIDCLAVVPSGAPFTPIEKNVANTKLDYYMSLLLLGTNLSNVTENITLPATLADGTAVTWSSDDTSVITNNGAVTRPINEDATVTLTATAGRYSKNFVATVSGEYLGPVTYAWIEGENYTRSNYTSTRSDDDCDIAFSGNQILKLTSSSTKGYSEYDMDLQEGTYDIYVRGGDDFNGGTWTSNVTPYVDGIVKDYTSVAYEGWPKWGGESSSYDQGWVKISSVKLTEGTHTIRWEYLDSRTAGSTYYAGGIDCLAVVPAGAQFAPISKDITNTKLDYYMSLLLSDYNLRGLKDDITLPTTALNGESITWTTSDSSIIANDGTITRSESADQWATLTATTYSYTKTFNVKVNKLTDFDVNSFTKSGNIGLGETLSASANLTYNKGLSKDATVVIALYDGNNKLLMCDINTKPVTSAGTDITAEITIPSDCEDNLENARIKAFIWDNMKPIGTVLESVTDDFIITELGSKADFHTERMEKYLKDSYDSISSYADGKENVENKPNPLDFQWEYLRNDKADVQDYTLKISENANMSNAQEYTVKSEGTRVYNLKVGTDYYWTVTANYADSSVTSPVSLFRTNNHAPRMLYVEGVKNVRDLGGWKTVDGRRVKQGLVFRSMQLSYLSSGEFKQNITAAGINTMKNELGIKSEIDIRRDSEMPIETYTESVLGADVNYYREPLNYNGDYLDEDNRASVKEIFEIFADKNNYPIDFHCAAGADRTGMIAYLLNGLLGVGQEDLYRDYLLTNFASTDGSFRPLSNVTGKYIATVNAYTGDTLQEKVYNYLSEIVGVSQADLDFIISYMVE